MKIQNKESVKIIGTQIWNPKQNSKQTQILCYVIGLSTGERSCRQDCKFSILRKNLLTV